MADFVINGGTHAFWKPFIIQRCGNCSMGQREIMYQCIDFLCTHSHMDMLGNIIQYSGVNRTAGANTFQFFYCANCFKVRHLATFQRISSHFGVGIQMALFIF